jgi:starch synthase
LDGLLRSRTNQLHGLLNGLDGKLWSPTNDQALTHTYAPENLSGKTACKKRLQKELDLHVSSETPIVAMITRLDSQKGIELVLESWDKIMTRGLQLVILGTGNPDFERRLADAASYYPGQVSVLLRFDDALSRRIYAGSDMFLMPSRYEPCGLGQLIALRYGSVPLVHETGGLADTIVDTQASADQANGFIFREYRHSSLLECLDRALTAYAEPKRWQKLMLQGMIQDISWAHAAERYIELYRLCTKELQ